MSALLQANGEVAVDPLQALRLRMIREVECFLEGRIGRTDGRRVIPACPRPVPRARSAGSRPSWYDNRGRGSSSSPSSGERAPC
jgi:hypothetical protein